MRLRLRRIGLIVGGVFALALVGYGAVVTLMYARYGHPLPPAPADVDPLLDRFMPVYDVVERHQIGVEAPAGITFAALEEMDLARSPVIRTIFSVRSAAMGDRADDQARPHGLIAFTTSLGWRSLAGIPGREIVMGAVAQPWKPDFVFRSIPPESFADFDEPGYVKIIWNLRVDAIDAARSIASTETRVIATDAAAREKFRRYWAYVSPGIILIRRISIKEVRKDAELRFLNMRAAP